MTIAVGDMVLFYPTGRDRDLQPLIGQIEHEDTGLVARWGIHQWNKNGPTNMHYRYHCTDEQVSILSPKAHFKWKLVN